MKVPLCCLWLVVGVVAQEREVCPYPAPRLASGAPCEVAWAAAQLTREQCRKPEVVAELGAALRRMQEGDGAEHGEAALHVLDAAWRHQAALPIESLQAPVGPAAHVPWLALQVRGATKDGRALFVRFRELDEGKDLAWEFVGDELAARGHPAFAIELRTRMAPTLRIHAGLAGRGFDLAKLLFTLPDLEEPDERPGWPALPIYSWDRDQYGRLTPRVRRSGEWAPTLDPLDEAARDRISLRWLAELGGEGQSWLRQFEVTYARHDLARFEPFAAAAETKARAALAAIDEQLRRDFKIPARVAFPELVVVVEDHRPDATIEKCPLPKRQ